MTKRSQKTVRGLRQARGPKKEAREGGGGIRPSVAQKQVRGPSSRSEYPRDQRRGQKQTKGNQKSSSDPSSRSGTGQKQVMGLEKNRGPVESQGF